MNLRRDAPPHSKRFGPTVMTSASAALLEAWSPAGTRWHLGSTGPVHSFQMVRAIERKLDRAVGADFAYLVQTEQIRFRVPGRTEESTLDLRVTMVFRREADGWRIVHRQADSQRSTQLP